MPQARFWSRALFLGLAGAAVALVAPARGTAEDAPEGEAAAKQLAKERLELMASRIGQIQIKAVGEGTEFPGKLEPVPIYRYDDPARGLVSAGLWRLGAKGRPLAIISTELQPRYHNRPRIVYEYLSLTDKAFTATSTDTGWAPRSSEIAFKPIPGSPEPAATERQRLLQMKNEAKRFTAWEIVGGERCELRLMPQPIERYTPVDADRSDATMFILAYGLNPEAILFVESDGKQFQYAFGRLTGASKVVAEIEGAAAWEGPKVRYGWDNSYTASNSPADIPGIAPDGTPLPAKTP